MNIRTDIARLERAGSEFSGWLNKLRQSIDDLVWWLVAVLPDDVNTLEFPVRDHKRYVLQWWPSREYRLGDSRVHERWSMTHSYKPRDAVLRFAGDVADGLLDDLARSLEEQTLLPRAVAERIQQIVEPAEPSA